MKTGISTRIAAVLILATISLPIVFVLWSSFLDDDFIRFPAQNGYTVRWYRQFWTTANLGTATLTSLWISAVATFVATALGLSAALAFGQIRSARLRGLFDVVFLLPLVVPTVVSAPALYALSYIAGEQLGVNLLSSGLALIAGHVVITIPWTYRVTSVGLSDEFYVARRASESLGMGSLGTFRKITLPYLSPHIIGGAIFAFIFSFTNLEVSLFLATPDTQTLPVSLMLYAFHQVDPTLAAAAVVQMALVFALLGIVMRFVGYRSVVRR